ncbi:MAG TPA: hypothetical protein GX717_04510 [Clostridiaceae bacterium]|nr:hypothetical protein [Clostridiaceae bacterium]
MSVKTIFWPLLIDVATRFFTALVVAGVRRHVPFIVHRKRPKNRSFLST